MKSRPGSLRGRLVAAAVVFIIVSIVATGLAVSLSLHRFVRGQIDQRLDLQAATLAATVEAHADGSLGLGYQSAGPPFDDPHSGWFWLVRSGHDLWTSRGLDAAAVHLPSAASAAVPPPPRSGPPPVPLTGTGPGGRAVRARVLDLDIDGHAVTVVAAAPLDAEAAPLRDALEPVAIVLLLLGCGLVGATLLQVRVGLRPLNTLRDSVAAVRAGRLERLPTDQPLEVRSLVTEMNSLLEQHNLNLERARRHVANLAHALKTPLATLSLALGEPGRDSDRSLRGLTIAMDRRIRHHLARARAAALGPTARTSQPLAARLADHRDAFAKIYAERRIRCEIDVPARATAACDAQDLDEMLGNVLDNAFKWARSMVRIEAHPIERRWRLRIGDDGPGLATADIAAALQPGRRLDETTPGDGFGLAITRELVELYGGRLDLASSEIGGLAVTFDLPAGYAMDDARD